MVTAPKVYGMRGTLLAKRRKALDIGQVHVARDVRIRQPVLSDIESEELAMPRGKSREIIEAMDRIVGGQSHHFKGLAGRRGCGCDREQLARRRRPQPNGAGNG